MEENRSNPRRTIHWRCALVVENEGRQETIHCRTNDISSSGVSVICHHNITCPCPVNVYMLVDPGNEHRPQSIVEVQGTIVNNVLSGQQGGFRLGIQFGKFAKDGKQILQKYLPGSESVQPARAVKPPVAAPAADMHQAAEAASATGTGPAESESTSMEAEPAEAAAPITDEAPAPDAPSEQA